LARNSSVSRSLAIVFAGTPDFAIPTLAALVASRHRVAAVLTQPDRPAGRGRHLTSSPVAALAREHGLPLEQPATLKTPDVLDRLAAHAPDLLVVVAYGLRLPPALLGLPQLGCVNVHASLLPRWRGAAPIQRAIAAGDLQTGISIMLMDAGLDTGPVIDTAVIPIGPRETAGSLHDRLARLGAERLMLAVEAIVAGTAAPRAQPSIGATYAPRILKEEGRLDFARGAVELDRLIRAFNPWPVAETRWRGRQLRIWEAVPLAESADAPAGVVVACDPAGIRVACGAGSLAVTRLQLEGRKPLAAAEFANAFDLRGEALGT
jgi:methionyl-tRNA formyltransferase